MRFNELLGQHNPEQSQEQNALRSRHACKMPVVFSFPITKLNAPETTNIPEKTSAKWIHPWIDQSLPRVGKLTTNKEASSLTTNLSQHAPCNTTGISITNTLIPQIQGVFMDRKKIQASSQWFGA